jgi:GT2 family glycosyltransferase
MDFSIIIPVFNQEDLTQSCLATLRPTLEGAGGGEVIVVDNGSRPETAAVLSEFPWLRVIRNETNLGFAAACNQGARAAAGAAICHFNSDIIALPGWLANMMSRLAPDVGVVGARLLFPDNTIQHAGVATYPARFGPEGIRPRRIYAGYAGDMPVALEPADFRIITGACMLTPRELFLELGGFDEAFWNGYEDCDYCLRVGECGLRVVYEPSATLYYHESQSGVARRRRTAYNVRALGARWGGRIAPDHNSYWARQNIIQRESFADWQHTTVESRLPPTTIVVHGDAIGDFTSFMDAVRDNRLAVARVVWLAEGDAPAGCERRAAEQSPLAALGALLDERSDRYFAFVDTHTKLRPGWLDALANTIEYGSEVVAATAASDESLSALEPCASDARCALLNLRSLPLHIRFGDVDTIDGAIVDLTWQAVRLGLGVRSVRVPEVRLASSKVDYAFTRRYDLDHDQLRRADVERMEFACVDREPAPSLASIVMLSWNAPEYTKMAVDSIVALTRSPYEIIIVDNGSGPETREMLEKLRDVSIIYNSANTGFAHGCNQGIAAARGTHIVLLNNDVVVTEGWLENLLDAHRRDPLVGVSAPRSNCIGGHQQINPLQYDSMEEMHRFAASRTREFAGVHYRTNRAIGFCLCIARVVIDQIGGMDTRYGIGNFEDDDFCIRVKAAGYQIVVCEDVFIHHFGSASFAANGVDHDLRRKANWNIFAARWGLPSLYPTQGYDSAAAIAGGFIRSRDYFALPELPPRQEESARDKAAGDPPRAYATAFVAVVDSEASWARLGPVVTNYLKALSVEDSALFAIGVTGTADAATIGVHIARSIDRMELDGLRVADIDVSDLEMVGVEQWVAAIPAALRLRVAKDDRLAHLGLAADRSPSGFLRAVRGEQR